MNALIKEIVAHTHGGNDKIIETTDFTEGAKYAIKWMISKNLINKEDLLKQSELCNTTVKK